MEENKFARRLTIKLKNPNPLFEKWLLEWHEEELAAGKVESIYSKALGSLRKFPLLLSSGSECIILEHFDKSLCEKLSRKLAEYEEYGRKNNGFYKTLSPQKSTNDIENIKNGPEVGKEDKNHMAPLQRSLITSEQKNNERIVPKKKKRVYVPMKRSAAYGILLALLLKEEEPNYLGFLTKAEVIVAAQQHSDVSMKKAVPGGFYSGWSSMSQLVSKGLVEKFSNPAKFKLTVEGRELALKLKCDCISSTTGEAEEPVLSLESASELIAPYKPRGRKINKISQQSDSRSTVSQSQELEVSSSQTQESPSRVSSRNYEFSENFSQSEKFPIKASQNQEYLGQPLSQSQELLDKSLSQSQEFSGQSLPESQEVLGVLSQNQEIFGGSSQNQEFETEEMIFLPNNFEIILLVDSKETDGEQRKDECAILVLLKSLGVNFEVRGLKIGDYIWIARDGVGREMVLPYIIERKRLDDLAHSIKDGRFHEQKFRLKLCGLQNKIYLVENYAYRKDDPFMKSIRQAIANTMVCDKFTVASTKNLSETAKYLANLTKILKSIFQEKTLLSCKKGSVSEIDFDEDIISLLTFADFSLEMDKNKEFTAREDFALQLVQLKGLSSDKAWAITEIYPTPKCLIEGFLYGEAETVISELRSGLSKNKIGPHLASVLRTFYVSEEFTG